MTTLESLIEEYQNGRGCDIDHATYSVLAILLDAVATGMSPIEGMHDRLFGPVQKENT